MPMVFKASAFVAVLPVLVLGRGFLRNQRHTVNATKFQEDISNAVFELQGCASIGQEQFKEIEAQLLPMWRSLPKNSDNRIERSFLRHMVHRYFRRSYSFLIRGFEEFRPLSDPDWKVEQSLSARVPAHLESILASGHSKGTGFDLQDAVRLVAVIEELILDEEVALLDEAYENTITEKTSPLSGMRLAPILEEYMLLWANHERLPRWGDVSDFVRGQINHFEFQRRMVHRSGDVFSARYSIDDARKIVHGITKSFGSFFNPVCDELVRAPLEDLDWEGTGRIPLSTFYSAGDNFAESVEHLRDSGALEESGGKKQVLIANYLQGTSNCFIATSHYMVCCANICESIHNDIEKAIGAPSATPDSIMSLVNDMSIQAAWEHHDASIQIQDLGEELNSIAKHHDGKVPLHGRLFAQWLHFAFPQECPFPHKAGTVTAAGPAGKDTPLASEAQKNAIIDSEGAEDAYDETWMSEWSTEEELMSDHLARKRSASGRGPFIAVLGAALLLTLGFAGASSIKDHRPVSSYSAALARKDHFV